MRIPRRLASAAALGTLALGGTAACNMVRSNELQDGFVRGDTVAEVRIGSGGSGDLTVRPDASVTGVDVRRTVHYRGAVPGQTIRLEAGVLTLDMNCGNNCSVSYDVRVPGAVKVTGSSDSGNVSLRGVSSVDIEVDSGDIDIDGATGSVAVKADSGNVDLRSVKGDVIVDVSSGDIHGRDLSGAKTVVQADSGNITLSLPGTGDVTATTSSGDIEVSVPNGCCRVSVDVDSGDQHVGVATDPASPNEVNLTANSGNITVESGPPPASAPPSTPPSP